MSARRTGRAPFLCRVGLHWWRLAAVSPAVERVCTRCGRAQWFCARLGVWFEGPSPEDLSRIDRQFAEFKRRERA